MNKKISGRTELSFNEAFEQCEYSEEGLFYEAEMSRLPVYYRSCGGETIKGVSDIDRSNGNVDLSNVPRKKTFLLNGMEWTNPYSLPSDSYFECLEGTPDSETSVKSGIRTDYKNTEVNSEMFKPVLPGLHLIAVETFNEYRNGYSLATIKLNVSKHFNISNHSVERIVFLNSRITLRSAIATGLLFVMREDMQMLISRDSLANDVVKPKMQAVECTQESLDEENLNPAYRTPEEIGLTIREIASAFSEISWDTEKWGKFLDARLAWVKEARLSLGKKGGVAATFDPVLTALHLQSNSLMKNAQLDKAFRDKPSLKRWADKWFDSQSPYKKLS